MNRVYLDACSIMGVMLESNIEAGNEQLRADRSALKYGVPISDQCFDWPTTERCILESAGLLRERVS